MSQYHKSNGLFSVCFGTKDFGCCLDYESGVEISFGFFNHAFNNDVGIVSTAKTITYNLFLKQLLNTSQSIGDIISTRYDRSIKNDNEYSFRRKLRLAIELSLFLN